MTWTIKQLKEVVKYIQAEEEEIVKDAKRDYFKYGGRLTEITKFTFEAWLTYCITNLAEKDSFIKTLAAGEPVELVKQLLAAPSSFRIRLYDEYRYTYLRTVFEVVGLPSTYTESDLMDLVTFMLTSKDTAVSRERLDDIISGYSFEDWLQDLIYAVLVKDKKYTEWMGYTLHLKAVLRFHVPAIVRLKKYYDDASKSSMAVSPPLLDFFIVHEVPDTDELTVESHDDSEAVGEVRLHSLQAKADAGTLYSDNHTVGYVVLKGEDILDYYVVPDGYKDSKKVRQRLDKLIEDFLKIGDFFK